MLFSVFIVCFVSFFGCVCKAPRSTDEHGRDGLTLLVCLNTTTAWHPPWTSSTANSPDPQLCGFMISRISLARLKLAQIYLNDAIILTIPVKYRSIALAIAGGSREEYSWCLGKDQPWLKPLETAQCWQSQCRVQKLFHRTVQALPIYLSNSFVLSLTC